MNVVPDTIAPFSALKSPARRATLLSYMEIAGMT
jgi:hypothetical protein